MVRILIYNNDCAQNKQLMICGKYFNFRFVELILDDFLKNLFLKIILKWLKFARKTFKNEINLYFKEVMSLYTLIWKIMWKISLFSKLERCQIRWKTTIENNNFFEEKSWIYNLLLVKQMFLGEDRSFWVEHEKLFFFFTGGLKFDLVSKNEH